MTCETKTQDNVFVEIEVSVQFKALEDSAYDAYYKLSNIREQIRSYVYDGLFPSSFSSPSLFFFFLESFLIGSFLVIRSGVPKVTLDVLFEQKDDLAQTVCESLDKTMVYFILFFKNFSSSCLTFFSLSSPLMATKLSKV